TAQRVTMPSGATLAGIGRFCGGSAIFDGSAVLLVVDAPTGRAAIVAHPSTARVLQRIELPSGAWRVAVRRGVVAVLIDARRIELVDARLGRRLGSIAIDRDVVDFAIDPDGNAI